MPVHVRRLRARLNLNRVANPSGESCLGLDVGVLNESRLELSFHHVLRLVESLIHISTHNSSPNQDIFFALSMDSRCAIGECLVDCLNSRQLLPAHGKAGEI